MRFVILHYHILKNAGSTVIEMLDRSFGERLCLYDTDERSGTVDADQVASLIEEQPRLQAFSSHQIRHPLPLRPGTLFFDICFLRDPVDRVRSMYDYFRKRPAAGDPISDLANRATPGEFIRGMVTEHALHAMNVQVNLLAQAGDSDEPTRADLAVAKRRIEEASFPGVVDLFDASVVAGEYFLRAAFPGLDCALPPVNVSKGLDSTLAERMAGLRGECEPGVFERLVEMNALDYELLEAARAEVMRRFHMVPDGAAQLDELRQRVKRGAVAKAQVAAAQVTVAQVTAAKKDGWLARRRQGAEIAPLFDAAFYLERNADVRAAGIDPLQHYLTHGAAEGRKPHRMFEPEFYLAGCSVEERAAAAANPLLHFLRGGVRGGVHTGKARPHPLFDGTAAELIEYVRSGRMRTGGIEIGDVTFDATAAEQQRFVQSVNREQLRALPDSGSPA